MTDKITAEEAQALIREAAEAGRISYQCCFCHRGIDIKVHALVLISNWDGPEEEQKYQQWFCHAECFVAVTTETVSQI